MTNLQRLSVAAVLIFISGCGGPKAAGDVVKGTVTLDGKPLETGRINLVPADNKGSSASADIKNGKFELRSLPGPKMVQITCQKVTGKKKPYPNDPQSPEVDVIEQILPAKYNESTELKLDVKAGGTTEQAFALESVKPAS